MALVVFLFQRKRKLKWVKEIEILGAGVRENFSIKKKLTEATREKKRKKMYDKLAVQMMIGTLSEAMEGKDNGPILLKVLW